MKKLSNTEIDALSKLLNEYNDIILNHNGAKIISLLERRRIIEERDRIHELLVQKRKKVFLGE